MPEEHHAAVDDPLWERALAEGRWNPLLDILDHHANELFWGSVANRAQAHDLAWKVANWLKQEQDISRSARVLHFRSRRMKWYFASFVQQVDASTLNRFERIAPAALWMLKRRFPMPPESPSQPM